MNQEALNGESGRLLPGAHHNLEFDCVRLTDATVNAMLAHGRTLEETIVALVHEKNRLAKRILELESLIPRKVVLPDGHVMVLHCPEELVPKMPNGKADTSVSSSHSPDDDSTSTKSVHG